MTKAKPSNISVYILCVLLLVTILVVDLNLPLGVAGGVPYILVILVSLWSTNKEAELYFAVICTLLVAVGFHFSPPGGEFWKVLSNRLLAVFAIWMTVIFTLKWRYAKESMALKDKQMENEKEKIYLATIYGSQHILNNLLNQLQFIKMEIDSNSSIDPTTASTLDSILEEGNVLMEKLSSVKSMDEGSIKSSVTPEI